jgi:hypothetical protein
MKFEATPEQQAKLAKLTEYFSQQDDGSELSWDHIAFETGIEMDHKGRNMVRAVLQKIRGRGGYQSVRGEGIILSAPHNALGIVNEHGRRVGRAIKNWSKTVENARDRYLEQMSNEDKQQILARVAFVGALKTMASGCVPKRLKK